MVEWAILAWVAGKKITIPQWDQSFFIHRVEPKEIYCTLHKKCFEKGSVKEYVTSDMLCRTVLSKKCFFRINLASFYT